MRKHPIRSTWLILCALGLAMQWAIAWNPTLAARGTRLQTAKVSVQPQTQQVALGSTAIVEVVVEDVADLFGVQVALQFLPGVVTVQDADPARPGIQVEAGDIFAGRQHFVAENVADLSEGEIRYSAALLEPPPGVSGSGTIMRITFEGIDLGATPLYLARVDLADSRARPIEVLLQHGTLEVVPSGAPTATPTASPTSSPTTGPTSTATYSPSPTLTATATATASATATGTLTSSPTATATGTLTSLPTATATSSATATATNSPTFTTTPSPTPTATATASLTGTSSPTATPTATVTGTAMPTTTSTATPTVTHTATQTSTPTATSSPTASPTATWTSTASPTATSTTGPAVDIRIAPSPYNATVGDIFLLEIRVEAGAQPVDGAQVFLDFEPAYLKIVNTDGSLASQIIPGGGLSDVVQNHVDNVQGRVTYWASKASAPFPAGTFTLAYLRVRAEAPAVATTLTFGTTPPRKTNIYYDYRSVLRDVYHGYVIISPSPHTATPTSSPTPTATSTHTPTVTPTATPTRRPWSGAVFLPLVIRNSPPPPTPTPTITPTYTATPSPTPTATATSTATFTPTATMTPTVTPTPTDTAPPTATPTATETGTATPTPTATSTFTITPTPTITQTPTQTMTPTVTPTPRPTLQLIIDPGFEERHPAWVINNTPYRAGYAGATELPPFAGNTTMRAGMRYGPDLGQEYYSSFQQTITLPSDMRRATLHFRFYPISGDSLGDLQYVVFIRSNGDQWYVDRWLRNDQQWIYFVYSLSPASAWAGETVTLRFGVKNDGDGRLTSMYVDEVYLFVER